MLGELIAILAVFTFVSSNVIFRKTEDEASPTYINFFRTAIGTITFLFLAFFLDLLSHIILIPWELWLILILSFLFGQVIGDTAYFSAQKELGTTIALAISMTFPLFTFILSLIFLERPFKINLLLSLLFIGFGITIIGKSKTPSDVDNFDSESLNLKFTEIFSKNVLKSLIYCLAAALGWAIGAVMIEYATIKIDQITHIEELSSIIGNIIRFPFALLILSSMVWRENYFKQKQDSISKHKKSFRVWSLLLIASILGTSLGSYLYTEAVHIAGADIMALIASAAPLFALPLTYLINKETISRFGFIGVIFTILGVIIIII